MPTQSTVAFPYSFSQCVKPFYICARKLSQVFTNQWEPYQIAETTLGPKKTDTRARFNLLRIA